MIPLMREQKIIFHQIIPFSITLKWDTDYLTCDYDVCIMWLSLWITTWSERAHHVNRTCSLCSQREYNQMTSLQCNKQLHGASEHMTIQDSSRSVSGDHTWVISWVGLSCDQVTSLFCFTWPKECCPLPWGFDITCWMLSSCHSNCVFLSLRSSV